MKLAFLLNLLLLTACTLNLGRTGVTEGATTELDALLASTGRMAKAQNEAQPISWDVSFEEAIKKPNPLTPPPFVLNSGEPPEGYQGEAGLWNCQTLNVGSFHCDFESETHMMANIFMDENKTQSTGQVGVFGPLNSLLVATCVESSGVELELVSVYFNNTRYKVNALEIGVNDEPMSTMEFSTNKKSNTLVPKKQQLFETLMSDPTFLNVRSLSADRTSSDSLRFVVKNFPTAWKTACGWHEQYGAIAGMR